MLYLKLFFLSIIVDGSRVILSGEHPDYIHAVFANVCFINMQLDYNSSQYYTCMALCTRTSICSVDCTVH